MKQTKDIIKEMDKGFDERFTYDAAKMGEDGGPFKIVDSLYSREKFKSFINSYTRTLLESFGEEIIGSNEDVSGWYGTSFANDGLGDKGTRNELRIQQRLKMKEILEGVGK